MTRVTMGLLAVMVTLSLTTTALAQSASSNEQDIPYTDTRPVIDGEKDDIYPGDDDDAGVFPMLNPRAGYDATGVEEWDLSGTAYAMWDEENLYIIVMIVDEALMRDTGNHEDDSVEMYIDGGFEQCQECYDDNDTQYRFSPGYEPEGIEEIFTAGRGNNSTPPPTEEGIEWTSLITDDGYNIEIAMPWEKNGVIAQTNTQIGFDIQVNDDDQGGASRDGKLHWADGEGDNQWQWANYFGTVTLIGGGGSTVAVANIRRTPSGGVRAGTEIEFDASNSTAPGTIDTYNWDFGDGNTASGAVVTHTYTQPGTFTVSLTVTDDGGVSGSTTTTVRVFSLAGTLEQPLEIPMAPEAPVIDGVLDAAYADAQMVTLDNRVNGSSPDDADDLSVAAHIMWDEENLYVFYDVTDEVLSNDSGNTWEDDSVELYIDGNNDKPETRGATDLHYELGWDAQTPTGGSSGVTDGFEFVTLTKDDGTGYTVEVKAPWANTDATVEVGHVFGFELMANDDDSPEDENGGRETKIAWFAPDGVDQAAGNASVWGNAVLVEVLTSAAEGPGELPAAFSIQSLYPNPFNPSTTALLNVRQPGDYTIRVHNVLGQLVHQESVPIQAVGEVSLSFDLSSASSGMYFFTVRHMATGAVATSKAMLVK